MSDRSPLFLLPGMTSHYPVFGRVLPLLPDPTLGQYPEPQQSDSLSDFAARIGSHIPKNSILIGVSFGGMLAAEISRVINPIGCIVISSILNPSEFPFWMKTMRCVGGRNAALLMNLTGHLSSWVPRVFRSTDTSRISRLAGEQGVWHRWGTQAILNWKPQPIPTRTLRIHGDADDTFPIQNISADIIIPNGKHALPVSHPIEVADAINQFRNVV